MMLTEEDVARIKSLEYEDFYYEKGGFLYLKNVNGKCVFLDENGLCKIYENRPEGCRFYPFLYDPVGKKIVRDEDCPHRYEFSLNDPQKLKELVMRILKERDERIKEDRQ